MSNGKMALDWICPTAGSIGLGRKVDAIIDALNELNTKVNAIVDLVNELKEKHNAHLAADVMHYDGVGATVTDTTNVSVKPNATKIDYGDIEHL